MDGATITGELLIIFILTLANGFFAASEIAIVSARRSRLEALSEKGSRFAKQALKLSDDPDRFLATVQVGITLIGTFSAAFGGARMSGVLEAWMLGIPALAPSAETLSLALVVALITYLSLIFGELVPKRLALRNPEGLAVIAAPVMDLISAAAGPVVAFLTLSVNIVMRLLRQDGDEADTVTEEDIVYMLQEGAESGDVELSEANLIQRVFQITDRPVRAAMTPRTEIIAVSHSTPVPDVLETFMQSKYSRIPVYQETVDNVIGILNAKDLIPLFQDPSKPLGILPYLQPVMHIIDNERIDGVMDKLRRDGVHMAIVLDEYGQTSGLVTLEDLLEELVGEIRDEYDFSEERPIVRRADGSWLVDGLEAYEKLIDRLDLPALDDTIDGGDFVSLGGIVMTLLGRVPSTGDIVEVGDFTLEIVDMDGRRVDKVLITRKAAE